LYDFGATMQEIVGNPLADMLQVVNIGNSLAKLL
jgi:hypothetical protein